METKEELEQNIIDEEQPMENKKLGRPKKSDRPILAKGRLRGLEKKATSGISTLSETKTQEMVSQDYAWKPKNLLDITNQDENYTYRWINASKLEKQSYRDYRDWEIITTFKSNGEVRSAADLSNKINPLDSTIRVGDLVLARMPKLKAESRRAYYRQKNELKSELLKIGTTLKNHGAVNFDQIEKGKHTKIGG